MFADSFMFWGFFLIAGYCKPAICPLPSWSTNKGASQKNSISSELTEELQAEKPLPLSVPSTLRYNISLAMFDIYRLPYITAIISFPCYICSLLRQQMLRLHSSERPNCDSSRQYYCEISSLFHLHTQTDVSVLLTLTLTWLCEETSKVIQSSGPPTAPHQ